MPEESAYDNVSISTREEQSGQNSKKRLTKDGTQMQGSYDKSDKSEKNVEMDRTPPAGSRASHVGVRTKPSKRAQAQRLSSDLMKEQENDEYNRLQILFAKTLCDLVTRKIENYHYREVFYKKCNSVNDNKKWFQMTFIALLLVLIVVLLFPFVVLGHHVRVAYDLRK